MLYKHPAPGGAKTLGAHQASQPRTQVWQTTLRAQRFQRNKADVRKYLLRLAVFCLSAALGTAGALVQGEADRAWPAPQGQLKGVSDPIRRMYVSESDPDLPKELSPYEVRNFVSKEPNLSLLKLWKALRINPNEFDGVPYNAGFFPNTCDNCEVEIWNYDLDGEPGTEALLRISEPLDQYCRYLIFKYANKRWKLLGHIDAWGKYQSPQHTLIVNRGRTWLAIRNQGVSGSGVASYIDFVYLVTPAKVINGFSYIAEGHQSAPEFSQDFNGRVVDCRLRDGVVTVEFAYSVRYWGKNSHLSTKRHRVVFSNRLGNWESRFDPARSNIAEGEFESIYHIE